MAASGATERWSRREVVAFAVVVLAGAAIRIVLLPTRGLPDDMDQFVGWVHHIAINGITTIYGQTAAGPVTFGPVMACIWGALAAIDPAFNAATTGTDPSVGAIMKLPASIADIGLAGLVAYALRDRPRWAVTGAAAVLLSPAVIDISAWWGQYESIYAVSALAAAILAVNHRNGWAAAAIAVSLMTKPQALPFLVPFAAWFWATGGWRGLARAAAVGIAVIVVLWLPFIPAGGPAGYLHNLDEYQGKIFPIASLRAWNFWWLVQEVAAGGSFVADNVAMLGPLTPRSLGLALAGLLELVVALAVVRNPRPRTLMLALATSILVAFSLLTAMHERYAYGALVFLLILIPEPRLRLLSVAFGVVFTLNLLAAIPPTPKIGALLPIAGSLGVVGSLAMLAIAGITFVTLTRRPNDAPA